MKESGEKNAEDRSGARTSQRERVEPFRQKERKEKLSEKRSEAERVRKVVRSRAERAV